MKSAPSFVVGQVYSRRSDIHEKFGGGQQSGISPSAEVPAIFVFTGKTGQKYGYPDRLDDSGVFLYSGEGQVGDMKFGRGNKALRDHAAQGRSVHVFHALGKGKPVRYEGEFAVANYSTTRGPDKNGNDRKVIVFHLIPVGQIDAEPGVPELDEEDAGVAQPNDLAAARKKAISAASTADGGAGEAARRTLYRRSEDIRAYVLLREKGTCRACNRAAPFKRRNGSPYLEAHHTLRLSDGGVDHPRFVAGICPNCHAQIHRGEGGRELNAQLIEWLEANEPLS